MKKTSAQSLAKKLGISTAKAAESVLKAKLITAISKVLDNEDITHAELSKMSGVPRTAVTGILSGSLQKVTIDRILKMLSALNLEVDVRVKKIAS
jgi:predicted XRE-type DNA-binding protein